MKRPKWLNRVLDWLPILSWQRPHCTVVSLSFAGTNQSPLVMLTKEYYEQGQIVYAEVLWST